MSYGRVRMSSGAPVGRAAAASSELAPGKQTLTQELPGPPIARKP